MKKKRADRSRTEPGADARWQALVERNGETGDAFVYGVRTTGVFCRPTCRSRLPRRENVRFFASSAEALQAGFRPCKRCQPEGPGWAEESAARISRACKRLEEEEGKVSLDTLAKSAGYSRFHFHRLFKLRVGVTPAQYQRTQRLRRFKSELRRGRSVSAAIYETGFGSSSRAYEGAARNLGMSPARYRAGGAGTEIAFGVGSTPLGLGLIGITERGVCALAFGRNAGQLRRRLRMEFPQATLRESGEILAPYFVRLREYLESPSGMLALPLDCRGTAFQCRVWQALRKVPAGQTVSYKEMAKRVGKPRAVRAVASACAANRIALAIPCHRAVRADGALGGYRWGLKRKSRLLQAERMAITGKTGR